MKIVLVRIPNGRFRFRLLTDSGEVVAASGTYRHKASALAGIDTFRAQLADAEVEDRTDRDAAGDRLAQPVPGGLPPI
ncbi:YegP family protein [Dactylosporangium aurantiacum]|uniref:YegP family protein n=1 Tax=Dactylosporangium aurantiacum TaxID=35754 RepID=A0A9Q9IFT5_9ACTN|nr:YegP family protein [Dactylosporangium aurantiacum]MDG6101588.1 YegP family protein [Dactylosporangium aurantiacum]UWZ52579.1 YegP family protein [Dactylosporangium aurantiacum]